MQPLNLNSLLPGQPLLNPRPASRLGLLLDALQPAPGAVSGPRAVDSAEAITRDGPAAPGLPLRTPDGAGATRLSEAGLMLAQMGMRPRTPLELILRFSAANTADDALPPPMDDPAAAGLHTAGTAATAGLAEMDSRQLAQQLRNVITRSGLFYESHVHEWMQGRRPLTELQQEPQQRWLAGRAAQPANDAAWMGSPHGTAHTAPPMQPGSLTGDSSTHLSTEGRAALAANDPAWTGSPQRPVPPALEDLVARQLDVLATRQMHLHLLPGQDAPVSLLIGQEHESDAASPMQAWVTEIECTLPELGHVHARLRLLGNQLAVTVRAEDANRADWLDAQLGELRQLLERSGLSPAVLEVRHEP